MDAGVTCKEWTCYYHHYSAGPDVFVFGRCIHTNYVYISVGNIMPYFEVVIPFRMLLHDPAYRRLLCYYRLSQLLTTGLGVACRTPRIESVFTVATFHLFVSNTETSNRQLEFIVPTIKGRVDWKRLYVIPYEEPLIRVPQVQYLNPLTLSPNYDVTLFMSTFNKFWASPTDMLLDHCEFILTQTIRHIEAELQYTENTIYKDPILIKLKMMLLVKKYPMSEDILEIVYKFALC